MSNRLARTGISLLVSAAAITACTGGEAVDNPVSPTAASAGSTAPGLTPEASPSATLIEPALPPIQTIPEVGGVTMQSTHAGDFIIVAYGRAWVSGLGQGMGIFDARTGRSQGSVSVPQEPCGAPAAGFGAIWTATCAYPRGVVRIDAHQARVTDRVTVPIAQQETSLGAGEGAIWAIANGSGCENCVLVRIDPDTVTVTDRFPVPPGASAVRAGLGGVWITYGDIGVLRVDPTNGAIQATIPIGANPTFLDIGKRSVWVMESGDGALCQIDPHTNHVTACTVVEPGGGYGDLTVGNGYVWWRSTALVVQVDPRDGHVVRRIGLSRGDGSAAAGSGQLWISAHDEARSTASPCEVGRSGSSA